VIDAFVGTLDLVALQFGRAVPNEKGRPPYAPDDLLKLLLWGYLNRVCSCRRLEAECGRNVELWWLLGKLRPDFKTIADFRRANAEAIRRLVREFVLWARELELVGAEVVPVDGTKLKASNHPTRRASATELAELLAATDARIAEYMGSLEKSETDLLGENLPPPEVPDLQRRLAKLQRSKKLYTEALAVAESTGEKAPLTDPECQSMQKVGLGYNAQIAVDAKHHLIVAAEIATAATDHAQLPVVAAVVQEVLEKKAITMPADAGYHDREALLAAVQAGVIVCVPQPRKGHAAPRGIFPGKDFVFEPAQVVYRCPAGQLLERRTSHQKHGVLVHVYHGGSKTCGACPLKAQCTRDKYRKIERWEHEAVMEEIAARVAESPHLLRQRKALVEHPFGTIKFWRGQGALLTRGRRMVQAELSLSACAYNLSRIIAVEGVERLLKALAARN
jgi:transposase